MVGFIGIERLTYGPWQAFERALQRLLIHAGYKDVLLVGGTGDGGGDVVANRDNQTWVIQAKFRSHGVLLGSTTLDELVTAAGRYDAQVAVLATNSGFKKETITAAQDLHQELGIRFLLWDGRYLLDQYRRLPEYMAFRNDPRPYQEAAMEAIHSKILYGSDRGLLLMATGLGKTRVAAGVIEQWFQQQKSSEVLLLSPSLPLIPQLEYELWPYLPKDVPTHIMTGSEKPSFEGGITIATEQSMLNVSRDFPSRYGLVVVDEAHHAPADGYRELLSTLAPDFLLGMTATPWRSDDRHLEDLFGAPTATVSIVEGMQLGYLAKVDYRMMIDDIDWSWVDKQLHDRISIKELNRRLFLPERDDATIEKIRAHLLDIPEHRALIFCRSIVHAENIVDRLCADGFVAKALHSHLDRFEAARTMREFRNGHVPILVAIDMVNEGIDIPDVNLIVFLRVTHSRRIFLQQLGRGLRINDDKTSVRVLDFVSDIRRIAEGIRMNKEAENVANTVGSDQVIYQYGEVVRFEGDNSLDFFKKYLSDIAELEEGSDDAYLRFPGPLGSNGA